jgi:hypothetical protein
VATCSATAVPVSGYLVRVHRHPDAAVGDPWFWQACVEADGDVAVIAGGEGDPDRDGYPAFLGKLRELGFKRRRWCRVKDGVVTWHEKEL